MKIYIVMASNPSADTHIWVRKAKGGNGRGRGGVVCYRKRERGRLCLRQRVTLQPRSFTSRYMLKRKWKGSSKIKLYLDVHRHYHSSSSKENNPTFNNWINGWRKHGIYQYGGTLFKHKKEWGTGQHARAWVNFENTHTMKEIVGHKRRLTL